MIISYIFTSITIITTTMISTTSIIIIIIIIIMIITIIVALADDKTIDFKLFIDGDWRLVQVGPNP